MAIIFNSGIEKAESPQIGKLETPIRMVIQHESDVLSKETGTLSHLFNIETSKRFGETIIGGNEFGDFDAVGEGEGAPNDSMEDTFKKFIEHIQYMKEFTITATMMEDAQYGVAADAKRRAENFTRAYYRTRNKIAAFALANGTSGTAKFGNAKLDLTTGDNKALFAYNHDWGKGKRSGSQSNYFYGDIFQTGATRGYDVATFENALAKLAVKMRGMKDENGEPLGYTADTIILPGNRPAAETIAKKVCGTDQPNGGGNAQYINTQFGNWRVIVVPTWETTDDRCMIMSSEANKALAGNMFFNRVPLTVNNWVDRHTGNFIWNGRCRFGVGFGSYKHIMLAVDAASAPAQNVPQLT